MASLVQSKGILPVGEAKSVHILFAIFFMVSHLRDERALWQADLVPLWGHGRMAQLLAYQAKSAREASFPILLLSKGLAVMPPVSAVAQQLHSEGSK